MGKFADFLSGFRSGLTNEEVKGINEVMELAYEDDDENFTQNYRDVALRWTESHNGWYTCAKCGRKFRAKDMDADHIVPKSKGGDNTTYNMQLICKHCNRSKQANMSDTEKDLKRREEEIREERAKDALLLAYLAKQDRKG